MKKHLFSIVVLFAITTLSPVEAQTIKLWGVNYLGGVNDKGNIFECSATGTIIDTCDMNDNGDDAVSPEGNLIKAYDGLLYGITYKGGTNNKGAIISYNPSTNKETTVHSFGGVNDGSTPYNGSLLEANDSLLYGMTMYGGTAGGVICSYNIATGVETVVYNFAGGSNDGSEPAGSLIQVTNNLLYGMTLENGANSEGTLFSFNISTGKDSILHNFGGGTYDGSFPYGSLLQVSDSVLYGMTQYGGTNTGGVIFSYSILTGKETVKYNFYANGLDAENPYGSFILANNGLLYGLTEGGGDDEGTIFSFNMNTNTEDVLHIFGNDYDGAYPYGDLMAASNGLLYGLTSGGGLNRLGTLFSFNTADSTETVLYNFSDTIGFEPFGGLLEDDVTTGVNQLSVNNDQLSVYPNPSNDFIHTTIQLKQPSDLQLRLVNMLGQTVWSADAGTVSDYQNNISVANLPDGVYLLEMVTGSGMETKEIVVAR